MQTRRLVRRARLLALLVVGLAGCGGADQAPPAASRFRVALLTPGSISDGGWNAGAYEGLVRVRDELGAEISQVETRTPADFEEGFRDYASQGYALVFGHGFEYQDAAAKVAAEFPATLFITTSGSTLRPNVAPIVFELEQATYLCGVLAARMTQTGIVGLVGGVRLPSIESTFIAFRGGVAAVRADVQVRDVYIGSFEDTASAREQAQALLEAGADFLLHQADAAGRGVFQAVSERAGTGARVYAFGTNKDQNAMAPDVVIASATLDIPSALVAVARRVRDGTFEAAPLRMGIAEGIVRLVLNPALESRIPAEVRQELRDLEQRIRAGELVVPRGSF
jgi:basic membrane lipoprotein Med (substrate-binding protein (PBP1-ABC) superfamily)